MVGCTIVSIASRRRQSPASLQNAIRSAALPSVGAISTSGARAARNRAASFGAHPAPRLAHRGREAGDRWVQEYTDRCYHQACDAWSADWDLNGAVEDMTLVYEIARELAGSRAWPNWNAGSEFRATRDASAAQRSP